VVAGSFAVNVTVTGPVYVPATGLAVVIGFVVSLK
jgi:hypothetical protein